MRTQTSLPATVNDVLKAQTETSTSVSVSDVITKISDEIELPNTEQVESKEYDTVDVDLTQLSSTLVYSEVYNMMTAPNDYKDKIIKMNGTLVYYHDDYTGNDYYNCVVQDATACCAQGFEFEPTNISKDELIRNDGKFITVIGKFDIYYEGEYMYCTLRESNAVLYN